MSGDIGALSVADNNEDLGAPQPNTPDEVDESSNNAELSNEAESPSKAKSSSKAKPTAETTSSDGATSSGGTESSSKKGSATDHKESRDTWTLFEVFVRARRGLAHSHVGSIHAPDAEMALRNARDMYTRRQEGVSLWVIASNDITATSPDEKDSYFEPSVDKIYRHPTFYDVPEGVQM